MKLYGGITLHSNNSVVALLDDEGRIVYRKRLPNDEQVVLQVLESYRGDLQGLVVESTYNWYWLVDGLRKLKYHVRLANPARLARAAKRVLLVRQGLSARKANPARLVRKVRRALMPTRSSWQLRSWKTPVLAMCCAARLGLQGNVANPALPPVPLMPAVCMCSFFLMISVTRLRRLAPRARRGLPCHLGRAPSPCGERLRAMQARLAVFAPKAG
jgi:hypothetical protein